MLDENFLDENLFDENLPFRVDHVFRGIDLLTFQNRIDLWIDKNFRFYQSFLVDVSCQVDENFLNDESFLKLRNLLKNGNFQNDGSLLDDENCQCGKEDGLRCRPALENRLLGCQKIC